MELTLLILLFFELFLNGIETAALFKIRFSGLGYSQAFAAFCVVSYYCALMALTLYYLVSSFQSELPWSFCRPEWQDYCIDISMNKSASENRNVTVRSSAELYFRFETEIILTASLKFY